MNIKISEMQELAIKDKALRKSLALLEQLDGLDITATRNKLLEAYTNLILEYEYLLTVMNENKYDESNQYTFKRWQNIKIKPKQFKIKKTSYETRNT